MAAKSSMLHVRVDDETKAQATASLGSMGLSLSDAVRLFLRRVAADQAFPFELKVPNAATRTAMIEADEIAHTRRGHLAPAGTLLADSEKNNWKPEIIFSASPRFAGATRTKKTPMAALLQKRKKH